MVIFLDEQEKNRAILILKKIAIVLSVCILYVVFVKITGVGIPCLIKAVTGKYCPGCGISRMFLAMLELDFKKAFAYNPLLMVLLPFCIFFGVRRGIIYIKSGNKESDLSEQIFIIMAFIVTVIMAIQFGLKLGRQIR